MQSSNALPLFCLCLITSSVFAQMGDNEGEAQPDLPDHILNLPSPVLSPQEALASFVVADGFKVQLVASEPMIEDPVAATFAPDGSLWVIEMRSFMPDVDGNREDEPISRVVHLRDTNGDGVMDESTVFLDKLVLPRAIAPSHNGILLVAPPLVCVVAALLPPPLLWRLVIAALCWSLIVTTLVVTCAMKSEHLQVVLVG